MLPILTLQIIDCNFMHQAKNIVCTVKVLSYPTKSCQILIFNLLAAFIIFKRNKVYNAVMKKANMVYDAVFKARLFGQIHKVVCQNKFQTLLVVSTLF